MSDNREQEYDEVLRYITEYDRFVNRLTWRIVRAKLSLQEMLRTLRQLPSMRRELNPLSGKSPEWLITAIREHATDDEKRSEYFAVAISPYPSDTLNSNLKSRFSSVNFPRLKRFHESKGSRLQASAKRKLPIWKWIGIILGVVLAFLLDRVPKWFVRETLDMTYRTYETWVILGAVGVVLFLLVLLAVDYWITSPYDQAQSMHEFVGTILERAAE